MTAMLDNLAIAAVIALAWLAYKRFYLKAGASRPSTSEKAAASTPSSGFSFPVEPLPAFEERALAATKPLPFRPFRWGPVYPQHMAIRNITEGNSWLNIDHDYSSILSVRTARTSDPSLVCTKTLPGYHAHALEALVEVASFLSTRFPALFKVTRSAFDAKKPETWGDSIVGKEGGAIVAVQNCLTGENFDFKEIEAKEGEDWNPMRVAGLLLQDDLAVMVEDEQGHYRFQAGSICTAGFWRLQDKIGLTLDEIHFKGSVPNYAEKYQRPMNRFFSNLREDKLIERNNYFFQVDDQLGWSSATNGTEKIFDQYNKGPQDGKFDATAGHVKPEIATDIRQVHFRTERQSLRRLPKTRAILFTVRTYLIPVVDLGDEPGLPGRMASGIRSWPNDSERQVNWYKGGELFNPVLLPYLDKKHEEQLAAGIVQLNEKGTTEEQYPY
ncbi:hypothetical protein JCM11251_003764 [Rhodosporidiobolus azoricus]